jgi:signal transduction histidine kinase/DNA-binding response OmpR family regulator
MQNREADHAAIRKVGKATVILKIFAIGLAVVLGVIYADISNRYTEMQSGIRENAMWSVYQLDREARNLNNQLSLMLAKNDLGLDAQKKLSMRYDILYSRMDMLAKAKFEQYFAVDAAVAKQLAAVQGAVFGQVAIFDEITKGVPASRASLVIANAGFAGLIRNTEQLVTYTNNTLSTDRAEQRESVEALERKSLVLIVMLVVIVGALILLLRRQLSSVRAAGLSFERMAGDLDNAYRAAEAGNRAKSQFMATMGHEIRTPLNAILGTVELMELQDHAAETAHDLKTIRKSGEALLDIINEILDFSKIEHGKVEIETRTVDVLSMAESVMEMMRGRALDSGNQIKLEIPHALERPYVGTDATRLRQVILNLMSNAVKFTSNGTVTLRVSETGTTGSPRLRIEVSDTGIGINDAGQAKLFLPFSQVDASITRKYGGTGLGLTICKEIVELLGGQIGVESTFGSGSTFWFEIPVKAATAPIHGPEIKAVRADRLPRLKVLLVEDNVINLHVATKFLAYLGQEIHTAENGAEAVAMAEAETFDIILMDMQMPVMDGIEATKRIRAGDGKSKLSPVVAMTANASDDDTRKCIDAGMDGFQSKPISMEKLRRIVQSVASNHTVETFSPPAIQAVTTLTDECVAVRQVADLSSFSQRKAELVEILGEDDFSELLDAFFDDATQALKSLARICQTGDFDESDRTLHTLKGAAANVGLQPIADLAQTLRSRSLQEPDVDHLKDKVDEYRLAVGGS